MKKSFDLLPIINHCPNEKCRFHNPLRLPEGARWYRLHGFYYSAQHGKVPRYRCIGCGRTFSIRSNLINRYLHFDDYEIAEIGEDYLAGASLGELARERGISINMVRTRLRRFFDFYGKEAC